VPAPEFGIDTTIDHATATIAADGELDIFSARDVAVRLHEALALGCTRVVIDVSGVSFVDASALGVFARVHAVLTAEGRTMEFTATGPKFVRLCSISRLDQLFGLPTWTPGGGTPAS
jgi:anti-sigma B factor antagonist